VNVPLLDMISGLRKKWLLPVCRSYLQNVSCVAVIADERSVHLEDYQEFTFDNVRAASIVPYF
jgi:hypothetical protein